MAKGYFGASAGFDVGCCVQCSSIDLKAAVCVHLAQQVGRRVCKFATTPLSRSHAILSKAGLGHASPPLSWGHSVSGKGHSCPPDRVHDHLSVEPH